MLPPMTQGEAAAMPAAESPPTIERDEPAPAAQPTSAEPTFISEPNKIGDAFLIGGAPDSFVKGGTTSSAHDALMAFRREEEERRRRVDDLEKQKVQEAGLHTGRADELATRYSHSFTDHSEIAVACVPLFFMGAGGKEVELYGTADIIIPNDPKFEGERVLVLFCPKCVGRGMLQSHCIIQVRQSNRRWFLDERKAGEMFIDCEGVPQRSAGAVMDSDRIVCGRCDWAAKIHNNRVYRA